uniref:Ubiquitin-like protease family profile domain-containing protein n=1 Tax=Chenopodium quinoa TaxID=63459 RepID=A0A803KTW5_CHEQI
MLKESIQGNVVPKKVKMVPKKAKTVPEESAKGGNCMCTVASGKEFVVTKNDVCDVFCLPMGDIPVLKLKKNVKAASVDNCILQAWRSDLDVLDKQAIPFFLTPTPNRTVSLKLLKPAISQTVVKKPLTLGFDQSDLNVGGACSSDTIGCFVQFELSDGVMTDDEIKQISTDFREEDGLERRNNENVPYSGYNEDVPGPNEDVPEPPIRSINLYVHWTMGHSKRRYGVSIAAPLKIRWCIVDCYALYLNEVACFESSGPQRFFFGVRQSNEKGGNSIVVNDLHGIWEGWVSYENPECDIMDFELIYVPILVEDHYVWFVIDHAKELIYYLENIIWCDSTIDYFIKLSFHLLNQLGDFLGKRDLPKSTHLPFYKFTIVDLEWRKTKIDNTDCGVFVMYHMLHFVELAKFNERKKNVDYVKEIKERRKAAIAEKKKREARKERSKGKGKSNRRKSQRKKGKNQTKKYTPSKE